MIGFRSSLKGWCTSTLSLEVNMIIVVIHPATQVCFKVTFIWYGDTGRLGCSRGGCREGCRLSRVLETRDSIWSTVVKTTT